jgi:hypothetical protein
VEPRFAVTASNPTIKISHFCPAAAASTMYVVGEAAPCLSVGSGHPTFWHRCNDKNRHFGIEADKTAKGVRLLLTLLLLLHIPNTFIQLHNYVTAALKSYYSNNFIFVLHSHFYMSPQSKTSC